MPAKLRYKSGIYKIENLVNGKVYIGSASNFRARWGGHRSKLKRGVHDNPHLQSSWNKYGAENFSFEEFAYVPNEKAALIAAETEVIATMRAADRRFGYNIIDFGERPSGMSGRRHTEEAKRKISEASIRNAPFVARGEQSVKAKLKESDINVVRCLVQEGFSCGAVGKQFGVTKQSIEAIVSGESWAHVPHALVDASLFRPGSKNLRGGVYGEDNKCSRLTRAQVLFAYGRETLVGDKRSHIAEDLGVSLCVLSKALRSGHYGVTAPRNPRDKMSWDAARIMRQMDALGVPWLVLAEEFRVSEQTVKDVVSGRTWRERA